MEDEAKKERLFEDILKEANELIKIIREYESSAETHEIDPNNPFRLSEVDIFPAGFYYVGDPCYVIPNEIWDHLCEIMFDNLGCKINNFFLYQNINFWVGSTAYGDGSYPLTVGGLEEYGDLGVDSGLLSIIPVSLINTWNASERAIENGQMVQLDEEFQVEYREGDFKFGKFSVDTSGDETEY